MTVAASVVPGENVEIKVQGQPASIVGIEPQKVTFQIPLNAPPNLYGYALMTIRKPNSPSWTGDQSSIALPQPQPALLTAVHQDFSAVITTSQPASVGEIIHLYGVGLGFVTPFLIEDPAPISPLTHTVNPVTCTVSTVPATVLFAGLAPGMTGIYQIDLELPNLLPQGVSVQVACVEASVGSATITVPVH